jgi:hypothetical protein
MDLRPLLVGFLFEIDEIRMKLPHTVDKPLPGEESVEVLQRLIRKEPRTVHPEVLNLHPLHDLDQTAGVVVVRMGEHHVVHKEVAPVVLLDVIDDLLAGFGISPIDDVHVNAGDLTLYWRPRCCRQRAKS